MMKLMIWPKALSMVLALAIVTVLLLPMTIPVSAYGTEKAGAFKASCAGGYNSLAVNSDSSSWDNPYTDVSESDWFYDAVRYVTENSLMNGTSANMFSPLLTITRGMAATILYRMAGTPDVTGLANPYGDVAEGNWYTEAVKWLANNGIIPGDSSDTFSPNSNISRQDLMVFIVRYAGIVGLDLIERRDSPGFVDGAYIAEWAKDAVDLCYKANIIDGYPYNHFYPHLPFTRAEFAVVLKRITESTLWVGWPITITVTPGSGGTASGGGTYDKGVSVTLKATPYSNFSFDGWYENNVRVSTNTIFSFAADTDRTLQARFTYTGGSGSGGGGGDGWSNPYTDVNELAWFYDAVRYVTENGLISGTSATTFSPNATCNRAALADALYHLEGSPAVSGEIPFTDVAAGDSYANAILWVSQNTIVDGYENGTFGPNDPVTREQIMFFLYRYATYLGLDVSAKADLSHYTDLDDISPWMLEAMQWAFAEDLIAGYPDATIRPQNTFTRAEFATIFQRYVEGFKGGIGIRVTINISSGTGGTVSGGGSYNKGASVTLIATSYSNYSFDGWYENDIKVSTSAAFSLTADANRTLQARFTYTGGGSGSTGGGTSVTTFTVIFNTNGGSTVTNQSIASGGKVAKPADPIRANYTFEGWYTDIALLMSYDFNNSVISNFTLYAKWTETVIKPETPTTSKYSDVSSTEWFFGAVQFVTEKGLMEGTGSEIFSPNVTMSRAMLVTVLYRLEGEPQVTGSSPFSDVQSSQWYTKSIAWASENSIVDGYNNGTFGLNDPVTREQAVTILYRYTKYKGMDLSAAADLSKFTDMDDISDWALDAMKWAVAVGIIQGRPGNKSAPKDTSTRAEVATIFERYLEDFLDEGYDTNVSDE